MTAVAALDSAAGAPGRALHAEIEAEPLAAEPAPDPVTLSPAVLPGGLGAHKWRDRRLLDELAERLEAVPLILDLDGDVLEAAYANVFIVEGTHLVTPPLDGRQLPGTVRARVLALHPAREERLSLDRIAAADELLLASSVRGIHPARLFDGQEPHFQLGARLRAALREDASGSDRPMTAGRLLRPRARRRRRQTASAEPLRSARRRSCARYIGGAGLGAWLMHRARARRASTRSARRRRSRSCFSPLVGTPLTTSAKFAVVAKSPLTGLLNDALASSHFAIAGKLTGNDAIVVRGACDGAVGAARRRRRRAPRARRRPLGPVRRPTPRQRLRERLGPAWRVAAIGPAGERLVRYATVSHDGRHAGRGGLGAVLGAKLLKAVAVRAGDEGRAVADPPAVLAAARDLRARSFGPATAKYRELGTLANLLSFNAITTLPTRNFQRRHLRGRAAPRRRGAARAARSVARDSCASCTIGCEHIYDDAGRRQRARGVRERVRARPAVRRVAIPTPCSRRAAAATSSASTRSPPAARSPGRWSAPSAA